MLKRATDLIINGDENATIRNGIDFSVNSRESIYSRIAGVPYISNWKMVNGGAKYNSRAALLVEDSLSASVASEYVNSISLLGTTCTDAVIKYLLEYDKLFIALDDDALIKSIKLQKQLSVYRPTFIIPIKTDIKYFNKIQLQELQKQCQE